MEKRGQVAMEFLMTYGWAILIILIAVGALWMLGVFSPSAPSNCSIDAPFSCQDVLIDEAGVSLKLALSSGFTGSVNSVGVNGESCDELLGANNIEGGQVVNIRCVKPSLERGESVSIDIGASSKKPSGFSKPSEGSATGEVKSIPYIQTLDPSMIAAYDFEDEAKEVSGNGNDGTNNGADCSVSGHVGKACSFDGADYISIGSISYSETTTLSFWFKTTDGDRAIFGTEICIPDAITIGTETGNLQGLTDCSGSWGAYRVRGTTTVNDGKWHHGAFVIDNLNIKIYVDGQLEKSLDTPAYSAFSQNSFIGRTNTQILPPYFNGVIDEFAIYDRVLSPEEIAAHANS